MPASWWPGRASASAHRASSRAAAWTSRHARGTARLWLHVATCVPLLTIVYYGFDGMQLIVTMTAAAVALRPMIVPRPQPPAVEAAEPAPALATA